MHQIQEIFQLEGKVAVITGASKGIGESIARIYGLAGAKVVISSRKQDALDALAGGLREIGIDVLPVAANAGNPDDLARLVQEAVQHFGGIDILVNNAAANPVFGPVEDTPLSAFDKIMDVNLKGPFELSKRCLPIMKSRGGGSIINISSIGGIRPEPQLGIYSVSKTALISLTKVLAKEWGAYGIRVNAICPGLIKTKFSQALWDNEQILRYTLAHLPIARVGTPEEIAALALFLAGNGAAYCTGAVFTADGGHTI
ncbi:MAG: SDR family NAD(P)-dependent oxidoreductase [Saprospiraceae bacterium]|jgi:NAD(P)-dependent dehydrogenase (short-subunit alcohol dehydrogenase family)